MAADLAVAHHEKCGMQYAQVARSLARYLSSLAMALMDNHDRSIVVTASKVVEIPSNHSTKDRFFFFLFFYHVLNIC